MSVYKFSSLDCYIYRCGIICLSEVAINTTCTRGVDHSTISLLQEIRPSSLGGLVCPPEVDSNDLIPHLVLHISKSFVSENSGVVDEDVDPTICIDSSFDNGVAVFGRCLVADCLASALLYFLDNIVRIH